MGIKKLGVVLSSAALSVGLLAPISSAATIVDERTEKIQIPVAATEVKVTKNDLIKKFRELFPTEFNFLTNKDFEMSNAHHYPNEDTVRYDLNFSKRVNGKYVSGQIGFVGEELEIEQFYYNPENVKDALFPAKVSKNEAQKIADAFLKKIPQSDSYRLVSDDFYEYSMQLTDPVRYSFYYVREENGIPVSDQRIYITVLGNGAVTELYRSSIATKDTIYDNTKGIIAQSTAKKKLNDKVSAELQYQINNAYNTSDRKAQLVYTPSSHFTGVHALSGNWLTVDGFVKTLPKKPVWTAISKEQLPPSYKNMSVEMAEKIAKELLKIDAKKGKLTISSIEERESYSGLEIYDVQYMYQIGNQSIGTSIAIDRATGAIIDYQDLKNDIFNYGDIDTSKQITKQEAIKKAVELVKKLAPTFAHSYANTNEIAYYDKNSGMYTISFPRIVNGIIVSGDYISVNINKDGSLNWFNVDAYKIDEWPSPDNIISQTEATSKFKKSLSVDLTYMKVPNAETEHHYSLLYTPIYNDSSYSILDARTGEWLELYGNSIKFPKVSHPTAEEELNYLIHARILEVKDFEKFNPDAALSKGEALKIMMKSLTYIYEDYPAPNEEVDELFTNIPPGHELYPYIENAVAMRILDTKNNTFEYESTISREELATWFVKALNLESAAQFNDIYKLNFSDSSQVKKEYIGYVAIAHALGLLQAENNQFKPSKDVTYAELAQATIRLAHTFYEKAM